MPPPFVGTAPNLVDLTAVSDQALAGAALRAASAVDAVVLHQMGFSRGNAPENYKNVVAHFAVLPNGVIAQLHPELRYLNASQALNPRGIAIEFAGNFPNENGTYWLEDGGKNGKHTLQQAQIQSGRDLLRHLANTLGVSFVFAHRQGYRTKARDEGNPPARHTMADNERSNCPGPDVWYHVGQWAVDYLGFSDGGPDFRLADGDTIPDRWRRPRT